MGNKVNPLLFRLGINEDSWNARWFSSSSDYSKFVYQDFLLRRLIIQEFEKNGISSIQINRKADSLELNIKVSKPSGLLSKKNNDLSFFKDLVKKKIGVSPSVNFLEEKHPDQSARLLSLWLCSQIEKRIPFRRAMKLLMQKAFNAGMQGVKVSCSGRLGGLEIARTEWYMDGKVPLHTLKANIDYSFSEALTTYGKIGVKVWLYKGHSLSTKYKDVNHVNT